MSNWGIGLLFGFGVGGRPEVMLIRDIEGHCPACGLEAIERRYDAALFHSLTTARLRRLLDAGRAGFAPTCTQCATLLGETDAKRWVLHYGFPSGRGLIQGFATPDGARRWLLSPHRSIDVQLVPQWETDADISRREVEQLDAPVVREVFGRELNPKQRARALAAAPRRHAESEVEALSADLAFATSAPGTDPDDIVAHWCARSDERGDVDDWVIEPLVCDGEPVAGFPGAPSEWITDSSGAAIDGDRWGLARCAAVEGAARFIFESFPVRVGVEPTADGTLALRLPDREGWPRDPELDPAGIAREAARSMLEPSDVTRLEIDRTLHALTGLWAPDSDK